MMKFRLAFKAQKGRRSTLTVIEESWQFLINLNAGVKTKTAILNVFDPLV